MNQKNLIVFILFIIVFGTEGVCQKQTKAMKEKGLAYKKAMELKKIKREQESLEAMRIYWTTKDSICDLLYSRKALTYVEPSMVKIDQTMTAVDKFAKNTLPFKVYSVEQVAKYLTQPFKDEKLKVRSIYIWMVYNLTYDYDKCFRIENPKQSKINKDYFEKLPPMWEDHSTVNDENLKTILLKKGVCHDYSKLFEAMCKSVGIECEYLSGIAFGIHGYASHAWNKTKINGKWNLFDVTWGSCLNTNVDMVEFYFMSDPQLFIYKHFPDTNADQLLSHSISTLEEFKKLDQDYGVENKDTRQFLMDIKSGKKKLKYHIEDGTVGGINFYE